ncbi:NUDIX domain-containing protein [Actinoplanes sp. NPDC051343]|uniref:NUDIX domain-containing protein n=1 Tax=Actinoplanes sp. NPDC051343 TaxID=3363906 RepID=UPI0037A44677
MTAAPPVHPVDVFLVLHDGPSLLLALRQNTGYHDGRWNLPSGKLEHGEDAVSGMIREAREELGIRLPPSALRLVTTVHHRAAIDHGRIGLVFAAASDPSSQGSPVNAEPQKCGGIDWFPAGALPAPMSSYSADCIEAYRSGSTFTLSGWAI